MKKIMVFDAHEQMTGSYRDINGMVAKRNIGSDISNLSVVHATSVEKKQRQGATVRTVYNPYEKK